jgi:hypothetical protein
MATEVPPAVTVPDSIETLVARGAAAADEWCFRPGCAVRTGREHNPPRGG